MGGCWLHFATRVLSSGFDADESCGVGFIGKAAVRLLPTRLVLSPAGWLSVKWNMHLSNINFENEEIWPYPCCRLCAWRLTNIMAARKKNGKRSRLHKRKVHICLGINIFTKHTGSKEIPPKGFTAAHLSAVGMKQALFHIIMSQQNTEYLLTIAATERTNTATATTMTITVKLSKRENIESWLKVYVMNPSYLLICILIL